MADEKLHWLEVIKKGPEGPVLVALSGTCLVVGGLHHYGLVTIPQQWLLLPWTVGPFSILLLMARGALRCHDARKKSPCAFSKLTQEQQQILIRKVQSGSRQIENEHVYHMNWFKELVRLNYIEYSAYYSEITDKGWKEVEKHLARKK